MKVGGRHSPDSYLVLDPRAQIVKLGAGQVLC